MTREETQKIIMGVQVAYPNFHVTNEMKTALVDMWHECLKDLPYERVSKALQSFIMADTKGFAPAVGQIRGWVFNADPSTYVMNEGQAWNLVYNALCNSNYHANEEYNKLPEEIRRAVGGPDQLREWAAMDFDGITVAESNFKRVYREIAERKREYVRLPERMQPAIEVVPLAAIEEKTETERSDGQANSEFVEQLLEKWRADDTEGTRT